MDLGALALAHTEFVLDLYKEVAKRAPDENAVLSPLSIGLAMAMVAAGATGTTLHQIASCLKLPPGDLMHEFTAHLKDVLTADAPTHGLQLTCANRIWVDNTVHLQPSFQNLLQKSYGAKAASVDFSKAEEACERVNKWAEYKTHGKIANVLPPDSVGSDTRLILANAIYFKGTWKKPFDASMTEDCDFFLPNGTTIKVPTMHSTDDQCVISYPPPDYSRWTREYYVVSTIVDPSRPSSENPVHRTVEPSNAVTDYAGPPFKALRLPYHISNDPRSFSMIVLLPNDRNGLREMEENLDIHSLVKGLEFDKPRPLTRFQLPKFKVSFGMEMAEALQSLGMERVFSSLADLGAMCDQSPLSVASVRQKAFVEVNEQGTEAAAVTTVQIVAECGPMYSDEVDFVADHPFMFLIREESSNSVVFTGRVVDPSKEQ
ncbi:hypothetical protein KC19_11G143100 [Ceratodon purpureus]|uniref:Serpin domain-containing protein n=1 Tax=Ceratodon purpureus TaxID=3225 RepID=A0A8T0GF13_CERPU|nr:hypothetical protein KC19_11G143100 [Ceratodon purpureus]